MPSHRDPAAALTGRLLDGRYRIVEHIADGGMASVWRAVDERLEREVAVKVLRPGLAQDRDFVARFRREALAGSRLNDPRVVTVYDQGTDGGAMYLVMELVCGRTLRDVIHQEAPLPPAEALGLLLPVARALGAAHRAGLAHRDVKPENVIVRADGQVKVADFGIARAVTSSTTAVADSSGTILGTVSYLSPEQVEHGRGDARSDVYSAGVVLFELLTGRKPFTGETPIHVAYQHVHGSVPAPSSIVPDLPDVVDDLVRRATARDPAARPADGDELASLIERATGSVPAFVAAPPPRPAAPEDPTVVMTRPVRERTSILPREDAPAPSAGSSVRTSTTSRRRRWPLVLVPLVLLAGGGGGGWWYLAGPGASTIVPEVVGVPEAVAVQRLGAARLDTVRDTGFSETVPSGSVIGASPPAGTTLRRGDDVAITLSRGPDRRTVPRLAGTSLQDATAALTQAGLAVGATTRAHDEDTPAGQVLSSDPAPGTAVKPGTPVSLVLSSGRRPVEVPDVRGLPVESARSRLEQAGLVLAQADAPVFSPRVPNGAVVFQRPASGRVQRGETVTVTLSKGPELVVVPDVVGRGIEDATRTLEAKGFVVEVDRVLGGLFDVVRMQSVEAGTGAAKGATITLTLL